MIEIDGAYGEGGGQILRTAMAEGESTISVPAVTDHLSTNLWVIDHFLPLETQISEEGKRVVITLKSHE